MAIRDLSPEFDIFGPDDASCSDPIDSAPVTVGQSISDTVTVIPTSGVPPEGTITFDVFGPDNASCSGTPAFSSTNTVANGDAASTPFVPGAPGVYRYVAHYNLPRVAGQLITLYRVDGAGNEIRTANLRTTAQGSTA